MAVGQRLISWLYPCSTNNVALNARTYPHGPHMGHPNWARCDMNQCCAAVAMKVAVREGSAFPHRTFTDLSSPT
jgi:hypothetical protein